MTPEEALVKMTIRALELERELNNAEEEISALRDQVREDDEIFARLGRELGAPTGANKRNLVGFAAEMMRQRAGDK